MYHLFSHCYGALLVFTSIIPSTIYQIHHLFVVIYAWYDWYYGCSQLPLPHPPQTDEAIDEVDKNKKTIFWLYRTVSYICVKKPI